MKRIGFLALLTMTVGSLLPGLARGGEIRVLTDRTESHMRPLFERFEKSTGVTVSAVYIKKGLSQRLKANPTEADLVITKSAMNLEHARKDGLLQPFDSKTIEALPEAFVDPDKMYFVTSYRPRVIYYSKARVKPDQLKTYMDLTKPEWKGKVAIRSGHHDYNISLFCQMAEAEGIEATKKFITGLKANLARAPQSNDRGQVQAIFEEKADLSIGNSYYMGIMMGREDQRPWALATGLFFPDQEGEGCYILRAGAGLTTAKDNVAEATKLLDYLASDFGQYYMATSLHVYSVKPGIPLSPFNQTLGDGQEAVQAGRFKARIVPLREIDKHREAVVKILNEVNFDQ